MVERERDKLNEGQKRKVEFHLSLSLSPPLIDTEDKTKVESMVGSRFAYLSANYSVLGFGLRGE